MARPDVVVIGAGVIGCAIARELAIRKISVVVLERGTPGREATWASAGLLAPFAEASRRGAFLELLRASLARWRDFAARVREASGIELEYRETGKLQLAFTEQHEQQLHSACAFQREQGVSSAVLTREEALRLEPYLSPQLRAALSVPAEYDVDNRKLGRGAWIAAVRAGAIFRTGALAAAIQHAGGRVTGVALADGSVILADRVIVAAGSWSGQLAGLPRSLPVFPVRGQMVSVESVPPVLGRVIHTSHSYIIPRGGDRILVGATVEHVGFRVHSTPGGIAHLVRELVTAVPSLADAPIAEVWAGLRPGTPDSLPILGTDPEVEGLLYATGHFRNGILLAPLTAEVIGDLVTRGTPPIALEPYSPARFAERR